MKALQVTGQLDSVAKNTTRLALTDEADSIRIQRVNTTDPIKTPDSVTEGTTRELDERGFAPAESIKS